MQTGYVSAQMGRLRRLAASRTIRAIGFLDNRTYMRLYIRHLGRLGLNFGGRPLYISPRAIIDSTDYTVLSIGDRAVISSGVRLLTHDFSIDRAIESMRGRQDVEYRIVRGISIGARAFIGAGAILMPGAAVGDDAIVGAGAVVRGDVPPGTIALGNPAQIVGKTREWAERAVARSEEHRPFRRADERNGARA